MPFILILPKSNILNRNIRQYVLASRSFVFITCLLCIKFNLSKAYLTSQYIGCFADDRARVMSYKTSVNPGSIDGCIQSCGNAGYTYAGAQYGGECWCGDNYNTVPSKCDTVCTAPGATGICGGANANSVYLVCPPGRYQYNDSTSQCQSQCGHCSGISCNLSNGVCLIPTCAAGWTGTNCDQDINECLKPSLNNCNQTCHNTIGSYFCSCRMGFNLTTDQRTCQDINECNSSLLNNCSHICNNTIGSLFCSCPTGYTLTSDQRTCKDVNECLVASLNECNQTCNNTPGSYYCSCQTGYRLQQDQNSCIDVNECLVASLNECNQTCNNTPGSYYCSCQTGYRLQQDRPSCIDIDECLNMTLTGCEVGCINTLGSFICTCLNGFALNVDNKTCHEAGISSGIISNAGMISLSAFIACVVILSVCLIAFIAAFTVAYTLYKRNEKQHAASPSHMQVDTGTSGGKRASSAATYEVPEYRNEANSETVYQQILKSGGSGTRTLYGEQFVER